MKKNSLIILLLLASTQLALSAYTSNSTDLSPPTTVPQTLCANIWLMDKKIPDNGQTNNYSIGTVQCIYGGYSGGLGWAFSFLTGYFHSGCPDSHPYLHHIDSTWGGTFNPTMAVGGASNSSTCCSTPQPIMSDRVIWVSYGPCS